MKKTNFVTSIILIAMTIGALIEIRNLPIGSLQTPQAGFFPLIVTILLGILSLAFLGQTIREKSKGEELFLSRLGEWKKVALTVVILLAFIVFFEYLGFLISTFLLIVFLSIAVGGRKWPGAVGFSILTAFVCYLLFNSLLKASLPGGIFKGFLGQ